MGIQEYGLTVPNCVVTSIDLNIPFCADQILGMLIMQSEIEFNSTYPYKWNNNSNGTNLSPRDKQLINLDRFLDLGKEQGPACLTKPIHFYLISEYGIPGLDGVNLILNKLRLSGEGEQIFIGGIDGLTKEEFLELMEGSSYRPDYLLEWVCRQASGTWINSAIIIEKNGDNVRYFVQPKLLPSPEGEASTTMLQGKWVLLFRTSGEKPIKFIVSVCFDWIGIEQGRSKLSEIADNIPPLTHYPVEQWIAFVPQYNPQPSHQNFMEQTRQFLWDDPWKSIHGRNAMVIMANSASNDGHTYGNSSFVFHNWASFRLQHANNNFDPQPTFTMLSRRNLRNCFEARLRKNRPAVHAVEVVLPFATSDTAGEDHYPLRRAVIHPIDGIARNGDPRYPNPPSPVCAYKKVLSDYLDDMKHANTFEGSLLSTQLGANKVDAEAIFQEEHRKCLTWDKYTAKRVFKKLCRWTGHCDDCDRWKLELEGNSLDFLLSMRSILRYADFNITEPTDFHGDISLNAKLYSTLIADFGMTSKFRDLLEELDGAYANKNLLVIATNRQLYPLPWKFSSPRGQALNFTNAEPIFVNMTDMLNTMRGIRNKSELKDNVLSLIGGV